jgi:hypothetical protein
MRGLWSTLTLVLVLAGLGAYIYFVDSRQPASGAEAKTKVFAVESDKIDELRITAKGESSVLVKKDSGWQITEPAPADADTTESSSFVTNLASLEVGRVVDENPSDLTPYGLAQPRIKLAFKAQGNAGGEILLGDKTPTQGDLYAMKTGEKRVFLVPAYLETTFEKNTFELRDKRVVKFERDKVDSVQVARGADTMKMTRAGSDWKVEQPTAGRADYSAVEGLITRLSTAGMATLVEAQPADLAKYGLDKPAVTITLGAGSSQTVLEVGKTEGERRFARDRARPMVFTLDTTLTDDLNKPFDDYRKKDLFEFRPFNVDRVRVTRVNGAETHTYEFVKTPSSEGDKWTSSTDGAAAKDADRTKVDDLLNKLSAIRAVTFVAAKTPTGLDRPVLIVGASYDGGKFERVRVGKVGDKAYGAREGEPLVADIGTALDAALTSLDTALQPPPPPADTKK